MDILAWNIVWVNGPYAAGKYPDIEIFRMGLAHWLDEFERVEADDGYIGEAPRKVKCPGCVVCQIRQRIKRCRIGCGVSTRRSMGG